MHGTTEILVGYLHKRFIIHGKIMFYVGQFMARQICTTKIIKVLQNNRYVKRNKPQKKIIQL